ncbi:MAG: hypothetical protein E6772_07820 [Dysgonomonas sp.]|nr:hypothetical protein [Dysgonomonas sp.]
MSNNDLKNRIETLIEEVESTHRYSMSRIYGLYNEAYETNEKPQSCASCLIRKVKELKVWLDNYKRIATVMGEDFLEDQTEEEKVKSAPKKKRKNGTPKE